MTGIDEEGVTIKEMEGWKWEFTNYWGDISLKILDWVMNKFEKEIKNCIYIYFFIQSFYFFF